MEVGRFAFIIHPLDAKRDVARKYPFLRPLPTAVIEGILNLMSPKLLSHITGIQSLTGAQAEGWFIGCPMTPRMMLANEKRAVQSIIACGKLAERLGAGIIGLGAYTAIVGDGGREVAESLSIAVTTGNSYTVATALDAVKAGAEMMDISLPDACAAVVGATGSIGRACATILSQEVAELVLVGRHAEPLMQLRDELSADARANLWVTTDVGRALENADIVITVTSALNAVIEPEHIKSGAVVCDVARPRDVSPRVAAERDDVLVIEGGIVAVPGEVEFGFDFGFPPRTAYACMAETIILALEARDGKYESFTLGKDITVEQVQRISELATKHGFKLAGFR
ncbi:MAG TPA: shikimate dehydrogenase, partial [Armatimonadetes bacterium]|nr:shikimate dehydrogenase [Armatimonadota bacterium]